MSKKFINFHAFVAFWYEKNCSEKKIMAEAKFNHPRHIKPSQSEKD
jgi:hypothetical protein